MLGLVFTVAHSFGLKPPKSGELLTLLGWTGGGAEPRRFNKLLYCIGGGAEPG